MARIIWGCTVEPALDRTVRVLLVITGIKSKAFLGKDSSPVFVASPDVDEVR
jgi:cell division GTPase FtsZ